MAESFASHFADSLLRKLTSNACEEASQAYGVFEDLQGIKYKLLVVRNVLSDADERGDQTDALREWLRQVQNILYDAEDVLELFELEDKRKQVVKTYGSTGMKVGSLLSSSNPLVFRRRMAREIKEIRHKFDIVAVDRARFHLPITLGRFIFSKFDLESWECVREHEIWELRMVEELKWRYDQMPSYLKQCFNYFSLYPKDFTFNSDEITSLWLAFGLVHSRNGSEKLEDIARGYIDELNSRLFLEDFVNCGYYCTFRVNGLMHDIALYVSKTEFLVVNSHTLNIPEQVRHISVVRNVSLGHAFFPESKSVRTILFPIGGVGLDSESLLDIWISKYKYLRVLDLSKSSFETLPNSVAKLEYLRILDLSCNRKIKRLPLSICNLLNLQVLSLEGCKELETLPEGLRKLISLRQLFITTKQYVLSLNEFASLNHLQALNFCWCDNLKLSFSGEQQLTSLETLIIQSCGSLEYLPLYIFPRLQTLFIADCAMLSLSLKNESPVQRLMMKHLHLADFSGLLAFPRWIEGAANTLETLVIYKFPNLKKLPECLTTMTHLKKLHILECPQLLSLPGDMRRLTALEDLAIDGCPELCGKCQPQSGEYRPMIAHIKRLFIGKPR